MTGVFESSMLWKAQKDGVVALETVDLRQFGLGPRRQVDDTPYGGGDGMLLKPEPTVCSDRTHQAARPFCASSANDSSWRSLETASCAAVGSR